MAETEKEGEEDESEGAAERRRRERAGEEVDSDDGEVGGNEHSLGREFQVEAKIFSCNRSNGVFVIHERHKRWERKLLVSRDQVLWIGEILLIRSKSIGVLKKKEGKIVDGEVISAVEGRNDWGSFISFQVGSSRFVQNFVVFPAGKSGCEWGRASQWIRDCFNLDGHSIFRVSSPTSAVVVNHQRSFVDVARLIPLDTSSSSSHHELENKICDLALKMDKILNEMGLLHTLVASLREKRSETLSVVSTLTVVGTRGGFGRSDFDLLVLDSVQAREDNSNCWGSMLSLEELRGSPSLNSGNGSLFGSNAVVISNCPGKDTLPFVFDEGTVPESVSGQTRVDDNFQEFQNLNSESLTLNLGGASTKDSEVSSFSKDFGDNEKDFSTPPIQNSSFDESSVGSVVSCTSWEEIYTFEKGQRRRKKKQITVDAVLGSEKSVCYGDDGLNQSCSGESSIQPVGVFNFNAMLREEQASCASISLPEDVSRGNNILIDGEYIDGFTIMKMLTPPPRAEGSKLAYRYWANLVARPLLIKLKETGLEIDVNIFGVGNWEI